MRNFKQLLFVKTASLVSQKRIFIPLPMTKINRLRSLTCFLLVLFLFTPVFLRSFHALQDQHEIKKSGYAKQAAGSSKIDGQFLYEEKEKEEKSDDSNLSIITPLLIDFNFDHEILSDNREYSFVCTLPLGGKIPIFLAQHSILI